MSENYSTERKTDGKIIPFEKVKVLYGKLMDEKADGGDLVGALSLAFSRLKNDFSEDVLADIADIYADMGEYELSDEFWYKYLSCAPENKKSVAYEELAINAFEVKNYGLAAYYLDKKISIDGSLDRKELGQEMLDFLADGIGKKDLYKIVYPEEKSDYSTDIAIAKTAAIAGNFGAAAEILKSVPKASPSYREAAEELSLSYFATGEILKAIEINRELLARFGGSVSVYSNLSSMYKAAKDTDKSAYYYSLAKELPVNSDDEIKLALAAVEQEDHITAAKLLEKIIAEDYYDYKIIFYCGLALFNTGEYEKAERTLKKAYTVNPRDTVLGYYARLAAGVYEGKISDVSLLPYSGDLPEKETDKRVKALNDALFGSDRLRAAVKRNLNEYIAWGLKQDGEIFQKSVVAAISDLNKEREELIADALISGDVSAGFKQTIIFMLLLHGYKKRLNVAADGVFFSFKPRKLPCEKDEEKKFFTAYCSALSKMAFSGENTDKIAFSINEIYNKFKDFEIIKLVKPDELAAAAVYRCGFESFKKPEIIYGVFGVKKEKIQPLINLFGENKDGENS